MASTAPAVGRPPRNGAAAALVAFALLASPFAATWLLEARWPDAYHRIIPEDGPVEWATFWAEMLSCILNAVLAWRARNGGFRAWWFKAGIALFSLLVAGEEISWGQRLIGFRPPAFFLADNIQLETNVHNLFRPWVWSAGIEIVVAGFGVVLPVALLLGRPRELARRLGVYSPPAGWIPGFLLVLAVYVAKPYLLCEEVVELAIGLTLAMSALAELSTEGDLRFARGWPLALVGAAVLPVLAGFATTWATDRTEVVDPALVAEAAAEVEALREDFAAIRKERGGQFLTECDLQARLASLDRENVLVPLLRDRTFWKLASKDSIKRAEYLLDPWNMPYWISDQCDSAARYILIYSYGPNRRRESTEWAIGGDDIGAYAFHLGEPRPQEDEAESAAGH